MPGLPEILVRYKGKVLDASTIIAIVEEASARARRPMHAPEVAGDLVFTEASIAASPRETSVLWERHWSETEVNYRKSALNPDWQQYLATERAGASRYFTARRDGELVGHLYFIVHTNRHSQAVNAVEDFFFFMPEHRRGHDAIKLLRYAIACLRSEGVVQIGMSSKLTGTKDIDPILRRVGFRHIANYYVI